MRFVIGGKSFEISRNDILAATQDVFPKSFDGRNRYYVEIHGKKFPIKQPIHLVTELPYTGGFTAGDASRVLKKLGFTIRFLDDNIVAERPVKYNASGMSNERSRKFAVTLAQDEDGFIFVSCPALPGCHSQGKTEEEAIKNIGEAIRGYIASMRRHGEKIPDIDEVREIEVAV